jgi:hypothetical protein
MGQRIDGGVQHLGDPARTERLTVDLRREQERIANWKVQYLAGLHKPPSSQHDELLRHKHTLFAFYSPPKYK